MALIARVKNSQSETQNGILFQSTFHVDDSVKNGIKHGRFVAIKADGKCAGLYGAKTVATLVEAGKGKAPVGIVYEESRPSQYQGPMEALLEAESKAAKALLPYGNIEDRAIGLLRRGVVEISDTEFTKYRHFNTVDVVLGVAASIPAIAKNATGDIPVAGAANKIKVGALVEVAGKKAVVEAIAASKITVKAIDAIAAATNGGAVKALGVIGKPVYLAEAGSELPFTLHPGTGFKVGFVESPIAVRFNLDLAL